MKADWARLYKISIDEDAPIAPSMANDDVSDEDMIMIKTLDEYRHSIKVQAQEY
jgi:hypothetical protein